ncbi:MAG: molybdopterin-dependent oxidoreductase [Anaerolineae bacterium]|nr:molybdopterin-dependent oxidoreductase [Anaerolineae bacterium]
MTADNNSEIITQKSWRMNRRKFLKAAAVAGGGATLAHAGWLDLSTAFAATGESGENAPLSAAADYDVRTMCEMCVWRCGVIAKVRNGMIDKLEGNPDHPHSLGNLCARGQSGLMHTYDPDRVLYPLMRVGERGSGRFRRATWDEALNFTAEQLLRIKQTYGPETMIFSSTHNLSQPLFENLLNAYGSPNYGTQRSLCFNAMIVAHLMTYGFEEPERKYEGVNYIILTGRNLFEAISTSESKQLVERVAQGAKLIVLDPRFTKTAAKATEWLPIKPGTDLAFHLALLNVIIKENLYNHWFVEKYTVGFDELAQSVETNTPEWAAPITEIPAETIRRIAREFAAAAPHAFAHPNWRTSNFTNSFQTERAIAILNALIGLYNEKGEHLFEEPVPVTLGAPKQPSYPRITAQRLDGIPWKYPLVPLKIGVFQQIRDSVLESKPYPARGWFFSRQNPVMSMPDRAKTIQAFKKLEFVVAVDTILNDSSWYADVILPECTYLERYDPVLPVGNRVFIRQPAIQPLGESRSALWIYKELGKRLGLEDYYQYTDEEDYIRQQIAPHNIALEQLKQNGYFEVADDKQTDVNNLKWNTPSGKVEIASETLRKSKFPAVPTWDPPPAPDEGRFYLLTGKVAQHSQFATQNNAYLNKVDYHTQELWLHPDAAAKRGIKDGDLVKVASEVGEVKVKVWLTQGIRQDCVFLAAGFGHKSRGLKIANNKGVSSSDVHVTHTDPISGGQALTQTFVTVERA